MPFLVGLLLPQVSPARSGCWPNPKTQEPKDNKRPQEEEEDEGTHGMGTINTRRIIIQYVLL